MGLTEASRASLVAGFDPTTKHHIVEALMRAPASPLFKAPLGEVSVSVIGEGGLVVDSGHVTGAILAMLNALSKNIMLEDDIVMMLEIDPTGNVRQKVQDSAFKSGIASLLRRNPWVKTLLVDMATRDGVGEELRQEFPDVEFVGILSLTAFKEQIKTDPRLFLQLLVKEDESTGGEGEESGTRSGEGKGGRSEEGEEGGREGGRSEEEMTASDSSSPQIALTRLVSKHLTAFLEIQEKLDGSVPTRIITPHRSGPRSTYSITFMLLYLSNLKTASKRPKDSFFQRASDLLAGTFDGSLPTGKTVKGMSSGLEKLVTELVDRVEGRGLSVEEGEGDLWTALNHLRMVLPEEIGDFATWGTSRVNDAVPNVFRVKGSATSLTEGMIDALKRMTGCRDPKKEVKKWPGRYLYVEVEAEDFVPDFLLDWKLQLGSGKDAWEYFMGAIVYVQHVDSAAIPHMTADVLLWEGSVVFVDTKAKTKKASINSTFKYNAPSTSDKRELAKRGPCNRNRITFPAVVGLLYVSASHLEDEEEAEAEDVEEGEEGGGGSSSRNRRSLEEGGGGERGERSRGTQHCEEVEEEEEEEKKEEEEEEEREREGGGGGKGNSKKEKKNEEEEEEFELSLEEEEWIMTGSTGLISSIGRTPRQEKKISGKKKEEGQGGRKVS